MLMKLRVCLVPQGIIAVEGLDLTAVEPGWYHQICLPAKMARSDGAPIRCLLQPMSEAQGHTEL
jgi:arylformamidase